MGTSAPLCTPQGPEDSFLPAGNAGIHEAAVHSALFNTPPSTKPGSRPVGALADRDRQRPIDDAELHEEPLHAL